MRSALLVLVVMVRCAFAVPPRPRQYEIDVSTEFTSAEALDVEDGARLWAEAIPELELHVRVASCTEGHGTHLCIIPNRSPMVDDGLRIVGCSSEIDSTSVLFVERLKSGAWDFGSTPDEAIRRTAAHEIGHQLGLRHAALPSGAAIMNPVFGDQSMGPTAADVAEFWGR